MRYQAGSNPHQNVQDGIRAGKEKAAAAINARREGSNFVPRTTRERAQTARQTRDATMSASDQAAGRK